jgi:adenylate cyclase
MFTDMVGFSRRMGTDEARMLRLLDVHNQIIEQAVAEYHGSVIKTVGDAFLVDFPSVVNAVQCAQSVQQQFRIRNTGKAAEEQIHVRIGIHTGDIVQRDGDVFGDGVNIASRLQALAEPDTICISQKVYEEIEKKIDPGAVVSLGQPQLKNIAQRFQVYALLPETPQGLRQQLQVQRLKLSRRVRPVHRVVVGVVLALIAGGLLTTQTPFFSSIRNLQSPSGNQAALPLPDKPSIVVLPFTNMSNDPSQDYFSDGITEDITTDLSRVSSLFVIARNLAFTYKGKAVKVQEVSKELGVRYVLEGSVRKANDQVRITTQLIDATTGYHLWSEQYDRPFKEIFAVQDEIRQKIVLALRVKLTPDEQERFRRAPTNNLEAYDFYLRGLNSVMRAHNETRKEANAQGRQMLEQATALDPQYAAAYAGLAFSHWLDALQGWSPDRTQSLERAFEMAQRGVTLDDSLPLPHATLGWVYVYKKQYAQALVEAERAITLDPNYAEGYVVFSMIQVHAGQPQGSLSAIEKAIRLNPRYPDGYLFALGFAYRGTGRCEEALEPLKKFVARNPNQTPVHVNLAICYAELGKLEEAQAEIAAAQKLNPRLSLEGARQTWPYKNPADLERLLVALRKAGLK